MQRWKSVDNRLFVKPSGEVIVGPKEDTPKDVARLKTLRRNSHGIMPLGSGPPYYPTDTGALRRVWSDPGSSEVRTIIYLPCHALVSRLGVTNATGYVYEGGDGVSSDSIAQGSSIA